MNYYNEHAKEYIESTKDCDMQMQYDMFLKYLDKGSYILDVGFGSGRDMLYFNSLGYKTKGIDITEKFVENGKSLNLDVEELNVYDLNDKKQYDGIWACASLLHCEDLEKALNRCYNALKENGIMYASFKYGDFKGIRNERYFIYLNEISIQEIISKTKFSLIEASITGDVREGRADEKWVNVILKS